MRLSDRLETVVSMVRPAESAADIGTDHGHVPVELVRRGTVKRALAMDVRKGPLSRAEESVAMAGLENRIETRLSDGLEKLSPGEAETVVIAGMGGELMIHILEQGRHMWDNGSCRPSRRSRKCGNGSGTTVSRWKKKRWSLRTGNFIRSFLWAGRERMIGRSGRNDFFITANI